MKPRRILEESAFDPQQLKVLFKAFDDAWEQIAGGVGGNPDAVTAARMKLATIIITLATNGMSANPEQLTEMAIELMQETATVVAGTMCSGSRFQGSCLPFRHG